MAGSGSLFGVMRVGEGPQALRGLLSRERRAEAEQNRRGDSSESGVEESRGERGDGGREVEVECPEGVVPRAACLCSTR